MSEPAGAGAPTHAGYRYGVRWLAITAVRELIRVVAYVFLVGGLSILAVALSAGDRAQYLTAFVAHGALATTIGAVLLLTGLWAPDETIEDHYARLGVPMLVFSTFFITGVLFTAGIQVATIGTVVYMVPAIVACYGLSRRLAVATIALCSVQYGLLLILQPGVEVPAVQWLFLTAMLSVTGILLGRFIENLDEVGAAEHRARLDLMSVNASLAEQVRTQVDEIEHYARLRRFLAPQVADAVMDAGLEGLLEPHRREIAVFFCDLRGFTSFAATVEPEDVLDVLNSYYGAVGDVMREFSATVGHFAGDGVMAYFNDPVPCDDPAGTAVQMAVLLRDRLERLAVDWDSRGYRVGYGMGVALGHATLGVIGFEGRNEYTPIGSVVNLAARLCSEAANQQILVDHKARAAIDGAHRLAPVNGLELKGFAPDVRAYAVLSGA